MSSSSNNPKPAEGKPALKVGEAYSNRQVLDYQLRMLEQRLATLSQLVREAVTLGVFTLVQRNHEQARKVIEADRLINLERYAIEQAALEVLTLQQPVLSRDLRLVAAVMFIAGELERIGDYAKGIARISLDYLREDVPLELVARFDQMSKLASWMLTESLEAFVQHDTKKAHILAEQDDEMDMLYQEVYHRLVAAMVADCSKVDLMTNLLWVAHNLERMGDRVTNICERTEFVETGLHQM